MALVKGHAGDPGNERADALSFFREARSLYKQPEDICRVAIHEIFQLRSAGREADGVALARKMMTAYPGLPAAQVFKMFDPAPAPEVRAATPVRR